MSNSGSTELIYPWYSIKCSSRKLFLAGALARHFFFLNRQTKASFGQPQTSRMDRSLCVCVFFALSQSKNNKQAHAGSVKLFIAIQRYHVIANLGPEGKIVTSKGNGTWKSTRAWIKWAECVNWLKSGTNSELANCACPAVHFFSPLCFPSVLDWDMRQTGGHIQARTCKN